MTTQQMNPPNILVITADEMRADCTGFGGNADVRTPHLDSLAARGAVMPGHFAVFPKCVPSRCSMLTGRYTHTDGLRSVMADNHLPEGSPEVVSQLRSAGYETAVIGLNHLWEAGWFYGRNDRANKPGAGVVHYTSYTEGPLLELTLRQYPTPPGIARTGAAVDALHQAQIDYPGLLQGPQSGHGDLARTEQACEYLTHLRDRSKPFYLQVNLGSPHPPYAAPEPWYSMYAPDRIHPFPFDLPQRAPLALRAQRQWRTGNDLPPEAGREIQAVYYAMISWVDHNIGRILATLEAQGLSDSTLIVFTSDHGDYAGQFGLVEKWDASLHDCLLRVPLVLAGPGIPRGSCARGLTEHVDIAPTLLDYVGLKPGPEWVMHGSSLLPVIGGGAGKTEVFADGGHEAAMRARFERPAWQDIQGRRVKATEGKQLTYQQCPQAMARCKMVRTEDWKLVVRETGDHELYALRFDPHERINRHGDAELAGITSELQMRLLQWCMRTDTDRPFLPKFGA